MRNLFTRGGSGFSITLLFVFCLLFAGRTNAQCNVTNTGSITAPTSCAGGSTSLGPGESRNMTFAATTWYTFSYSNGGNSYATGFCLNGSSYSSSTIVEPGATTWAVGIYRGSTPSTWSTTSATLTYVLTTPTAPTWLTEPTTVCSGTAVAYSVNAGSYNDYWLWSVTNGSVTSGQGTTSATITFSGTSPASITVTPYNGGASGCAGSALTSSSITVTAQPAINTTPTCSPATGTTICAGYNSGTVTGGAGTGGTSCTDSWTYSINNGSSTSAYTNGSAISTTGGTTNIIVYQSRSAGTGAGCAAAGPTAICTWPVGSAAVAPTLSSASPASGNTVCTTYGNVSATATGGSGGSSGSANAYQYSINGGSSYSTYTSGSNIPTSGASGSIIVQAERTAGSYGCTTAGWNTIASWPIASPAVAPTLNVATPANGTAVCTSYGTVSCTTNAGSGGSTGAADAYQYSINNGSTWSTYTPGLGISTTSATGNIIIQAERTGTYCATVGWTTIATWPVNQLPTITLSSIATTCPGSNANLPYTATTNSPNQYSTAWGTTAISAGFTNVSNTSFTSSPIHLTVPSTAPLVPVGPYTGNITVTNSTTGCTSTSYAISVATGLSGTYTVGTGGNFSSLTAAVNYANTYGLCGPTVFKLISSTYSTSATSETFPIVINALSGSSSSNTLTIVPNTGVSPTITGSATYGLIQLNACSYVTINGSNSGGTTQNLTITNTNNSTAYATGIWVSNNAGLTTGASYNTIENCIITSVTGGSYYGFAGISQSSGTNPYTYATVANVNNTYTNNYIYSNWAVGIYLLGPSSLEAGNVITNNQIGTTSTSQMPYYYGIFVDEESGVQITGNTINGVYNTGTGSAADIGGIITGSNGLAGTTTSISNNTISNITATGTQWSNGIAIDGPWPGGTISGNIISSVTSSAFPSGISINGSVSSGSLSKNQISSITSTTSGANVTGIYLSSTTSSTGLTISNNYIWNITSKGYSNVSGNGIGIYAVSGGSYYFYFNTISLSTAQSSAGYPVALYVASGSTGNVAEDNIFSVSETGSTANYALYSSATSTPFTTINYNDYYVGAGTTYGFINGSSVTSIAGMATSFGGNTFSGNIQPNFVSSTNLDLNNYNNFCLASGIAISGISTDIHGTTRTVPVIGADEAQFAFTGTTAASTCLGSSSLITVSDASSTLASGSYTVVYSVSNPASAGNSATMTYASGTNSGTFTVPASLLTNAGSVTVTITSITPASPSCSSLAVKPMILTGASTNYATLTVYSTVVAPTISGTPSPSNASAVCANYGTLTANITAGSGGSTGAADAYQYSINGGSSYTSISPSGGVISISTSGATGNIILQAERTGGTSCSTVGWNTLYTWTLQTAPVAPVLSGTPSPSNASAICANYGNLTANVTAGSGGGAGAADAYQYSLNGGSTFTTVFPSAGVITIPAGGATGSIILQAERTGGTNCNTVGWNTLYTWTLQTAPIAPVLSGTPSPTNASAVCANYGNLTANVSAGSGGGSGAADAYQYSINGGSTYTSVSPSGGVITIPAGGATGSIILQAERIGGTNCSTAGWNTLYTWTLRTAPVAPVLSGTPSPSNASAICAGYGTLTVNVTAGSGGGSGASDAYQYSKDGGSTYAPIYASGGVISIPTSGATGSFILQAERTGGTNCGTVGWNTLYTWTLQSTPVSAVLSGGTSPICNNTTPASFTTTAGGGSGTYAYLWYLNGSSTGITTSTYTTGSLTATSTVYCVVTSSGGCGSATTSSYIVSVDGVLSATLGGGTTPVCYNTTPASFTATVSGGSGTYSYLWYINNAATGITTSTYTTGNLISTSTVYCAVTSTGGCGSTNTGTYTVNVDGALVAGISGGTSPICYNTAPGTFTAVGSYGTGSYTYLWYLNSSSTGVTTSTYAPGNLTSTSTVYCQVTSGACGTASTSSYTATVLANLTASQSGGTSPVCYNTDPGTLTVSGSGGTGSYTYLWYLNGSSTGITTSTYDPGTLSSTSTIYCAVTSGSCGTISAGSTTITVYGNLTASQSGGTSPICYNTAPGTFTATGSGGTGSYTYLWYKNATTTGVTTSTYAPGNLTTTSTIYCAVTSGSCGTAITGSTTITVYGNLTASISGGTTPACYNSDPGTFTATGSGGTGTYTYQWYNTGGSIGSATSSTYDPGTLTASNTYSCSVTSGSCGTVSTGNSAITVEPAVTSYGTLAAPGGLTQTVCDNVAPNSGSPFTVSGAAGSSGTFTYQWYYQNGLVAAPGGSSTSGWTACSGVGTGYNTASFSPGGTSANITYACFVTPSAPVCGTGQWATNDAQVTVLTSGPTESSSGGANVCIGGSISLSSALSISIPATYQWYSSTNIGFTSSTLISGATSTTYSPSTSTAGTLYYEVIATFTGSGCSPATSNAQTVVVYAAPSATISGGTSPICYNTSPGVFTVTPSGGSGSFTYQWYNSGGLIGSATNSTYNPGNLTSSNSYYASVTDVAGCGTAGTSTTSITVDANLTASISGGTSPICYNTSPGTYTATAGGGTGTYTYQWFNGGGSISGATSSTYTAPNLTASNSYYCAVTSGSCGTVNTAIKNVTVHSAVTATVTGGTSPICYNTAPGTFTVIGNGGTGTYTYQWYNSSGSISGATLSTYAPGNLTASDSYTCSVTSGTCGTVASNTKSIVVDANLTASISGGTSPICYNSDPGTITATGVGGTGTYTYQWYNGAGSISGATASTYDPGNITSSNSYTCSVTSGSCGTVASNTISITVESNLTASISGGTSPVCYNGDPGTITVTASGGTGTYTYQWYNGGGSISGATTSTYDPGSLTVSNSYHCSVTSGGCGTVSTSTTGITVDANLTASISGGTSPICYNTDPGTITATGAGGTGTYTYQWYHTAGLISGATASTYDPGNITANDSYTCSVTSGSCGTAASNTISITVDVSLTASISGGTSPICYNSAPGTFTATGTGGTGTYTYQWYNGAGSISGATASTYAPGSITASDAYHCSVTSGSCGTANSNTISITVDANLSASISGGTTPICYNTSPGVFTATGSGGTGTYTYQWYNGGGSISGATASTYNPGSLTISDSYHCSVTSGGCGTVSTSTTGITVDANLTASIAGGSSPICYSTAPGTFTATASGGTGTFTYQWYNGSGSISGATASTYAPGTLTTGDSYTCSVTSGSCGTATSNTISITVDANLSASISGGTTPVCYNSSPGTFTATGTGGTGTYTYQWYNTDGIVSGATSSTFNPGGIAGGESYTCSITSGTCGTATSNTISISVDAAVAGIITGGTSPICYNTAPGTFTVTGSGGIGSYTFQWYNSSGLISGATASTYAPSNLTSSETYSCSVTSGSCGTASSNTMTITVDGNLAVSITTGTTPLCYNSAPGTFTASATGGTGTYTYQWYNTSGSISGATATTYAPGNLTASDAYTCSVTSGSCGTAASNTASITVYGNLTAGTVAADQSICSGTVPAAFTSSALPSGGTGSYTYQWQSSPDDATWTNISGATSITYTAGTLTSNTYYRREETSGSCGTVSSNVITITMVGSLTAITPTVSTNPVCVTSSGGGTNVQIASSVSGVNYQLQTSLGTNVGSAVAGTGGLISLPTGNITTNTSYQVMQTLVAYGCSTTTPANINVVAVNPDIAFGGQLSGKHYTFGTLLSPALPAGWSTPANSNSNSWGLQTANPASSGSYSYINSSGGSSSASTGAYIQTQTGVTSATPTIDLITGAINATGFTNISVQWAAQKTAGYTGTVSLYYSVNGGSTWTAVSFTDVPANLTGTPWTLVNNTVQVKLPSAADNASSLMLKWSANPSTGSDYYSMNDIGIYGLGKIINCGTSGISLPYLNSSCTANEYSLTADATNPWPSSPAFDYVTNTPFSGSSISIAVPATTANGTYNLDIKVDDGAGNYSGVISFPVTQDLMITATPGLDNCSCNYTTSGGIGSAYGNIVTVYASGGAGTGYYFSSAGVVDTLLTTVSASGVSTSGTATQTGTAVKGVFWSKADGATHTYKISDGYCTTSATRVTQGSVPTEIPFGNATGQPIAITSSYGAGHGGGNGISGSFNNSGLGDPSISNVNGTALTCHQTADFGNNWVVYQVNNVNSLGVPLTGDSTNNKAVVEINNNGVNLDSVEVSVYRDAYLPPVPNNLSAIACSGYTEYAMERHFMIKSNKSTGANSFNDAVGVRLYFTDAEFQDLAYWTMHVAQTATGDAASCAYGDTVTNLNSIYVTKYTGTNEDGDYTNNSPSGLYRVFGKNAVSPGNSALSAIDGGAGTLTTGGTTNLHYVQMDVKEFSEFWLGGSQDIQALPVEMVYLEAEAMNNDSIQVRWATQTEINNREFDVERSTDGNTWTTINVTPGQGNSVTEVSYAYNDLDVVPGVVYYYRLKQVDNNGNFQYTGVVQAEINAQGAFAVMNFVPNPTSGNTQLTVVTTKSQEITVDFYDVIGQKVYSSVQELTAGNNRIDFDLRRFAAGTYSAVVTSENQLYTKKVVITR